MRTGFAYWYENYKVWYCYASTKRASWTLKYTKHRVLDPKGKMRFKATRRKNTCSKGGETVQSRFFEAKWRARDWCYKWWCKYSDYTFESLHTVSEGRRKAGHKVLKVKRLRSEAKKAGLKPVRRRKILRKKVVKSEIDIEGFGSFLEKKPKRRIQTKKS